MNALHVCANEQDYKYNVDLQYLIFELSFIQILIGSSKLWIKSKAIEPNVLQS